MSVHMIYMKDGAKMMRPVLTREEYLSLRNGGEQQAIVKAVTNYNNPAILAELSEDLGEAMVGINESEIVLLMAERGK